MHRAVLVITLILPMLMLSACGETPMTRYATARQQWHNSGITSYRITVEYIWNSPFTGARTLDVRNDTIVRQPQPCPPRQYVECLGPGEDADRYTVPGLFGIIQSEMTQSDRTITSLEFDRKYGYPTRINSNTTKALPDLSYEWRVSAFMPLT